MALLSNTTVGDTYNIGLMNDRLTIAVMSGLVLVAGAVLVTAAHVADLLRLSRYTAGIRMAREETAADVTKCAKCGRLYPENEMVTHDGALWCRDDYEALGTT